MNLDYNISFDIAGLVVMTILTIVLNSLYIANTNGNKLFRIFLFLSIITGTLDILTAFTISNTNIISNKLNIALNTIYFLANFSSSYAGTYYIRSYAKNRSKFIMILNISISLIYIILIIINLFTGIIFNFNNSRYTHGPLYYLVFIIPGYFLTEVILTLIIKRKDYTKRQLFLNSGYPFIPLLLISVQLLYPSILVAGFALGISALMMFFALESPDYIELEELRKNLEIKIKEKTSEVLAKQKEIENISFQTIQALAQAIDEKDVYTRGHSSRVSAYSVMLAEELGWSPEKTDKLKGAALLHDIGKIGISESLLNKPNKLSEDEFLIIQKHTNKGGFILHNVIPDAELVAKYHHEWFNGTGYPGTHVGKQIPEFARIVAITDAYDAMATQRPYRDKLPKNEIRERLIQNRGIQFDPDYLDVFINMLDKGTL